MYTNSLGDDLILDRLSKACKPGDEFLDLCCGSGRVLVCPLKHGIKAVGIDSDLEMLTEAQNYLSGFNNLNFELIQADALDLNFIERFKVITCVGHCMSFFRGKEAITQLLKGVYKSMVPGGLFFIESYVPGNPKTGYHRKLTFNTNKGELTSTLNVSETRDESNGFLIKVFTYDIELGDKKEQEVYNVCEVGLEPIIEIARNIGFKVDGVFGDSNATVPFDEKAETQSLMLSK